MQSLPAFCDNCGAPFPSGMAGGGGSQVFMVGCKSGPCPECGGMGSIPDGHYSVEDALINFLSGPQSSYDKLSAIAEKITEMRSKSATSEQILEEVGKISPGFGWFGSLFGSQLLPVYLGLLLAVSSELRGCNQAAETEEAVRRGVTSALHQYEQQRLTPAPAEPEHKKHREPAEELHQDDSARSHDGPEDDAEADHGKHDRNKPDYI